MLPRQDDIVTRLRQSLSAPRIPPGFRPQATRTIVRGPDGKPYVQFVDVATNLPVPNLSDYEILESGNELDAFPTQYVYGTDTEDLDSGIADEADLSPVIPRSTVPTQVPEFVPRNGGEGSTASEMGDKGPRQASNNFGYSNAPGWVGYTGLLPGPLGMVGTAIRTAIKANDTIAVNSARQYLGLPTLTGPQIAAGTIGMGNSDDGFVGDVRIGDETYGVGFEALTPDGRTALTPEEARKRSLTADQTVRAATSAEIERNRARFDEDTPDPGGIAGVISNITGAIGKAFGWSPEKTREAARSTIREVTPGTYTGRPLGAPSQDIERRGLPDTNAKSVDGRVPGFARVSPSFNETTGIPASLADSRPAGVFDADLVDAREGVRMNYAGLKSASRNQMPDQDISDLVQGAVAASLGPGWGVNVTSGKGLTRKEKASGSTTGKGNHVGGHAVDFTLSDPQGRPVNANTHPREVAAVASKLAEMGAHGVGVYDGTQGQTGGHIHADITPGRAGRHWGGAGKAVSEGFSKAPAYAESVRVSAQTRDALPTSTNGIVPEAGRTPAQAQIDRSLQASALNRGAALSSQSYNSPREYAALSPQDFFEGQIVDDMPAGMRNNNPGNLKYTGSDWQTQNLTGLVGPSKNLDEGDPQAVFSSPQAGMDSMARLAVGKFDEGFTTVREMIAGPGGWTPGKTFAAENVAATMGVDLDQDINLRDPDTLKGFMSALTQQEHGPAAKAYTTEMYDIAVNATLFSPDKPVQTANFAGVSGSPRSRMMNDETAFGSNLKTASTPSPSPAPGSFSGAMPSPRSMSRDQPEYDKPASSKVSGSLDTTSSSGFAGPMGSLRSNSRDSIESSFDRGSSMAEKGDRATGSSSGFMGGTGSPRSQSRTDSTFDTDSRSNGTGARSSSGFAGSSGSARSASKGDTSFDGGSGSWGGSSKSSGGFAGSSGSARSASQKNSDFDGPSKSSGTGTKSSSGGFAGGAGSARSASQGDSNYDGPSKSSGGLNTDNAKGMSERTKDDTSSSPGSSSGKSSGGGLGGWK